jgi:hypothetical protein
LLDTKKVIADLPPSVFDASPPASVPPLEDDVEPPEDDDEVEPPDEDDELDDDAELLVPSPASASA